MSWNKKYKEEDLKLIPSKPILSDFGKAIDVEDRVELYVYSSDGATLLFNDTDIETYKVAEGGILDDGTINQDSVVFLDLHNDIRQFVNSGTFKVKYNFFRTLVGTPDDGVNDLFLDEISSSRTEIRLKISADSTIVEQEIFEDFGDKLSIKGEVDHWVDVHVNFGNGVAPLVVNWQLDKVNTPEFPYSLVLKLYEPLPDGIDTKVPCWIVQEMITPVEETVFVESPEIEKQINILATPNFNAGVDDNLGGGTTGYESWSSLTNAKETVLNKILNRYFSGSMDSIRPAIDYRRFSHFVRFGSAEERLKNFRYKLQQIEYYDSQITDLQTNTYSSSFHFVSNIESWKAKRNDIIAKMDGYEDFLFNQSASYVSSSLGEFWPTTWPKQSDINYPKAPYKCLSVSSSAAIDWYAGAIESASLYDRHNIHSLQNTAVPLHVHEDPTLGGDEKINGEYIKFVDMIGQFYDEIYLYVSAIPELWDRHNVLDARLIEGQFSGSDMLSKDLLYVGLQSLGYSQCQPAEGSELWSYILGTDPSGSYGDKLITENIGDWGYWNQPDNKFADEDYVDGLSVFTQTKIYASDWYQTSHSVAKEDVRLEYSKRILNNLPHLLKTKGTLEGLKAYMNIYGVPQTLFKIKESTAPQPLDYFANHYYLYDYYSYALSFNGSSALTASWDKVTNEVIKADNGDRQQFPDTIEFRYKIPDMMMHNLKCGKLNLDELENNANKKDMVIAQINSSSFIAVEHASKLPSGSEEYSFSTEDNSKYGRMVFALGINDGTFQYPREYVSCSTDWAPIFDGDWWNCMVRRNAPTNLTVPAQVTETFTYELFCKKSSDWSRGTITHEFSASMTQNGGTTDGKLANISWNSDGFDDDQYVSASFYTPENTSDDFSLGYAEGHFGTNYDSFFIGGAVDSHNWGINRHPSMSWTNYSGSLQELRFWMKPLTESAFNNHVLNPMAIDGNTYTSSYTDLIARWSLGADLKTYAIGTGTKLSSSHPNQDILRPFSGDRSVYLTSSGFTDVDDYEYQYEKVATIVPNYIGLQPGDKIRIEENGLDNGNLSSVKRSSTSARDNQPKDENKVSVQLTPVDMINIDIEHQLGGIDFNDLVGDPRARYMEFYPDVVFYDNHYWLKHFGPFQYSEFFKLVKYYDGQILCQLKKSVPGRSKPDFNITIEPHILERPRFAWRRPDIEHTQLEGSMSARVHLHGNTTELGRFKHNGPGDPFYSDWDKTGPLESRYGDNVYENHRFGNRDQAHIIPPTYVDDIAYGTGGQRERERNVSSLFKTTTGEIEVVVKDPYDPIIRDNVFNCWERDQHAPFAARYEWMLPVWWSGSAGSYYNYQVSTLQTVAATAGKTEVHISGTWPGAGTGFMNATEIVVTTTDGTVNTIVCGDARTATAATATITLPTTVKAEWQDEAVAALHSASVFIADTTGSYFQFHGTGSTTQPNGQPVSSSAITLQDYADNLADTINAHVSFSATTGSTGEGNYTITITQARAATMPSESFLVDGTFIGYDSAVLSGSLFTTDVQAVTNNNMQQQYATATDFSGGNTAIAAPAGADITYTNNNSTLADRVRVELNRLTGITCGTKNNPGGTHYVIPVTQSTAGKNGNTSIKGNFFGPWNSYFPDYGYLDSINRISSSLNTSHDAITQPAPFSGGKDLQYIVTTSLVEDTTLAVVTQSNPYWERDAVHILSHPMDPREDERWYDFNKQEYVSSNLIPNKVMSYVNRQANFPIINAGLTSYADQQSCRDRGKEWFLPFIGNQRISFYKHTETHRYATDLSASLGIKIPRTQFGQASFGYGNISGESIVSHSGADIQNLAATSPMSKSAQYQDYRPKGLMNLIYDGCMMSASDFNVDSPQTVDGGPVVEIIDTTPFVITAQEPTLGEGPGAVSGEGIGRGGGRYTGRDITRVPAAGKDQVVRGGRVDTSRDPIGGRGGGRRGTGRGRGLNYIYRSTPGPSAPTNPNLAL